MTKKTFPVDSEPSFETALADLEATVQNLESGKLTLEESLVAYRRGTELLKHCQGKLSAADAQIRILEDGVLKALDDTSAAS